MNDLEDYILKKELSNSKEGLLFGFIPPAFLKFLLWLNIHDIRLNILTAQFWGGKHICVLGSRCRHACNSSSPFPSPWPLATTVPRLIPSCVCRGEQRA